MTRIPRIEYVYTSRKNVSDGYVFLDKRAIHHGARAYSLYKGKEKRHGQQTSAEEKTMREFRGAGCAVVFRGGYVWLIWRHFRIS